MPDYQAVVYHNWGFWVADCPFPDCANAEHYGRRGPKKVLGGLQDDRFYCQETYGGCGRSCAALWPKERAEIEALMERRAIPNRNWVPGETLTDLAVEEVFQGRDDLNVLDQP